ncbi:MAG: PilZ domain-containing protein [Thermodesulfobacteriota bacterium]
MSALNRRKYVRLKTSRPVEFSILGRRYQGTIMDESTGGVYVQVKGTFSLHQEITINYTSPQGISIKKSGRIVRIVSDGIAVEFKHPGYAR